MTGAEFAAWRYRLGMTQVAAAAALRVSPSCVQAWEQMQNPVPRITELAMAWVESHMTERSPEGATSDLPVSGPEGRV